MLHETIARRTAKGKQDACHYCLTDTDVLGVFRNAKTFLHRHMKESVGVLQRHQSANGSEGLHEQQAFAERELLSLGGQTLRSFVLPGYQMSPRFNAAVGSNG